MSQNDRTIRQASVPPLKSIWVLAGPALILMGLSQGSGELWLLPRLHAKYGLDFTWIIFYGTLFQLPLLIEAMRTTALTGQNPLYVLARHSRLAALFCLLLATIAFLGAAGFILAVGEAIWRLVGWPIGTDAADPTPKKLWALAMAVIFATPIWLRRAPLHQYLEYLVGACSIITLLLFLGALIVRPELLANFPSFLTAMMNPLAARNVAEVPPAEVTSVVVGFTYMGLGGWYCIFYPLWGKNRKVGLAGALENGSRGDSELESSVGITIATNDEESRHRLRQWMKAIRVATSTALAGNALTVMLTSMLAYGLLHATNIQIGSDWDLVTKQAAFFEPILGRLAPIAFTIAVGAFFLDTWAGTYVSLTQLIAETGPACLRPLRRLNPRRIFLITFTILFFLSLFPLIAPISPGSLLLKWMGILMFCSMPLIGALLYFLNHRLLPSIGPDFYKPSKLATIFLVATTLFYAAATVFYVYLSLR